jgi:CheY-like chemotaxis protein
LAGLRILVAEDEVDLRETLADALTIARAQVETAPDGDEAFVSAMSNSAGLSETQYMSSVYRMLDGKLTSPVLVIPLDAVNFSK